MDTMCTATTTMFLREQFLAGMLLTVGWISILEIVFKVKATSMPRPGPITTNTNSLFIQSYNLIWLLNHLCQPCELRTFHVKFTFTWQKTADENTNSSSSTLAWTVYYFLSLPGLRRTSDNVENLHGSVLQNLFKTSLQQISNSHFNGSLIILIDVQLMLVFSLIENRWKLQYSSVYL